MSCKNRLYKQRKKTTRIKRKCYKKKMKNDFNRLITRFNTIEKNNAIENNPIEISQKRKKKIQEVKQF